jgi:hypothetical protein
MKKLFIAALALMLLLSTAGCGGSSGTSPSEKTQAVEAVYSEGEVFYEDARFVFSFVSLTADDDYLGTGDKFVELVMSVQNKAGERAAVGADKALLNGKYSLASDNAHPDDGETETFRVFFRGLETTDVESITFDLRAYGNVKTTKNGGYSWTNEKELFSRKIVVTIP